MKDILTGNFARWQWQVWPVQTIRVVNWNVDRGLRLPEIAAFLEAQQADLLTLQEVDLNARRTGRRNVAEELARRLGMNYVFGLEFEELTQGSRISPAYHGQATLSRWGLTNPRIIRFRAQSEFWRPRWFLPRTTPFQERLGGRIALITDVEVPGRALTVYNVHLESRGNERLRVAQLTEAFDDAAMSAPQRPALVAGDLNCDISARDTAALIELKGFRNVFQGSRSPTTPSHTIFRDPRSIDWALVSGLVSAVRRQVHTSVNASDHYPLTFTLQL
jgi:endonuclease/exonuclease/phosphatase family metal-dependent hydrolase